MTREEALAYAISKKAGLESEINKSNCGYGKWVMYSAELDFTNACVSALRPITGEQLAEVWRGEWKHYLPPLGAGDVQCRCTRCGRTPDVETPFCAWCGAPMTDKAADMVMERLEALRDES